MSRFYTKQTKIFGPKNFHIWIFLKVLKKLFVAQKINLEDTLIFFPWLVKQIWNWNTKNKNLWLIYTFKCHLFMFQVNVICSVLMADGTINSYQFEVIEFCITPSTTEFFFGNFVFEVLSPHSRLAKYLKFYPVKHPPWRHLTEVTIVCFLVF